MSEESGAAVADEVAEEVKSSDDSQAGEKKPRSAIAKGIFGAMDVMKIGEKRKQTFDAAVTILAGMCASSVRQDLDVSTRQAVDAAVQMMKYVEEVIPIPESSLDDFFGSLPELLSKGERQNGPSPFCSR